MLKVFCKLFGGIMKCDVIAEGIVEAVKEVGFNFTTIGTLRRYKC